MSSICYLCSKKASCDQQLQSLRHEPVLFWRFSQFLKIFLHVEIERSDVVLKILIFFDFQLEEKRHDKLGYLTIGTYI